MGKDEDKEKAKREKEEKARQEKEEKEQEKREKEEKAKREKEEKEREKREKKDKKDKKEIAPEKPVSRPQPEVNIDSKPVVVKPVTRPLTTKVAPKPAEKPVPKPAQVQSKPTPAVKPPETKSAPAKPVKKSAEPKPAPKPTPKPVEKTTPKPTSKSTPKPTSKPIPKPTPKPAEKPAPKPTPKPVEKPVVLKTKISMVGAKPVTPPREPKPVVVEPIAKPAEPKPTPKPDEKGPAPQLPSSSGVGTQLPLPRWVPDTSIVDATKTFANKLRSGTLKGDEDTATFLKAMIEAKKLSQQAKKKDQKEFANYISEDLGQYTDVAFLFEIRGWKDKYVILFSPETAKVGTWDGKFDVPPVNIGGIKVSNCVFFEMTPAKMLETIKGNMEEHLPLASGDIAAIGSVRLAQMFREWTQSFMKFIGQVKA